MQFVLGVCSSQGAEQKQCGQKWNGQRSGTETAEEGAARSLGRSLGQTVWRAGALSSRGQR